MNAGIGDYTLQDCVQYSAWSSTYTATDLEGNTIVLRLVRRACLSTPFLETLRTDVEKLQTVKCNDFSAPIAAISLRDDEAIAYRWVQGTPLSKLMRREGWSQSPISCAQAVRSVATTVLETLHRIHHTGCAHRDIRPSHLIVSPEGRVVLGGFGPVYRKEAFGTEGIQAREFAMFAAPELQHEGQSKTNFAHADLYSLGVVLYNILLGHPPFVAESAEEIASLHGSQQADFDPMRGMVPAPMIEFIERLMAPRVSDRYAHAEEAIIDLQRMTMQAPVSVPQVAVDALDRSDLEADQETGAGSGGGNTLHVLVIDDVEQNRQMIGLLLEEAGATASYASGGIEAIAFLDKAAASGVTVDGIMMDLAMPEMDGYQTARAIRKRGYAMPIAALTTEASESDQTRCTMAGCDAYLEKPLGSEPLAQLLRHWSRDGQFIPARTLADKPSLTNTTPTRNETIPKLVDRLRSNFLASLDGRWTEYQEALSRRDYQQVGDVLHWIKDTSGTLGLHQISLRARHLEDSIRETEQTSAALEALVGKVDRE